MTISEVVDAQQIVQANRATRSSLIPAFGYYLMSEKLYLIGNGFDLYHGMKTSYSDFCSFVKGEDSDVHRRVERFLSVEENWSDLEEALSTLDIDDVVEDANQFLMTYGADEWSDSGHHDYQYEIEQTVKAISRRLLDLLIQWIGKVTLPLPAEIKDVELSLDKYSKVLNFNYTLTLEKAYGHDSGKIFHVHGNVLGIPCLPILGHSWNPDELTPDCLNYSDENMDSRVIEGNQILKPYFESTFKPTESIIEENQQWFERLRHTKSIYVWGHSLSEVDAAYFYEICRHINTDAVFWYISHHNPDSIAFQKAFMKRLGISKNLVEYRHLTDFVKRRA